MTNAFPPPASCTTLPCDEFTNAHGGATFQTGLTVSGVAGFTPTGNTTCTAGATSCVIGPSCGTGGAVATCLDATTAFKKAGDVFYRENTYVVQAMDPALLDDAGFIVYSSECNFNGGVGTTCSTHQNTETTTNETTIDTCGVGIVKQLSCDGGASWATSCTAFTGDPIQVRYMVTNTQTTANNGLDLNTCTVHDVTGQTAFPPGGGGTEYTQDDVVGTITTTAGTHTITTTAQTTQSNGTTPLTCNDCASVPAGAPTPKTAAICPAFDTAEVDCVCGTTSTHVQANAGANHSCETCSVAIDKQVTCNGTAFDQTCCNFGSTTVPFGCSTAAPATATTPGCDPTGCGSPSDPICLQSAACIGFNAYCTNNSTGVITNPTCTPAGSALGCTCPTGSTLTPAQNVDVNYFIDNTGQDSVTCTGTGTDGTTVLGFTDTDLMIASGSSPAEGTVNTCFNGSTTNCGTSSPSTQELSAVDPCSPNLSTAEVNGDTGSLACQCNALANNTTIKFARATDSAIFSCQQPELTLTKTCGAVGATNTGAPVSVTATNNGTAPLTNCTVTDSYLPSASCPQTAGTGTTPVTLTGTTQPFTLAASVGTATLTGTTGTLTANACNEASVTCNIAGSAQTITATAEATCPVGSNCESVTPGFFKNHPESVDEAILATLPGGQIQSCGLFLNNAEPNTNCSVIDDLAIVGGNAHNAMIDPTDAQLVYQCITAELNLQATISDGGNCANDLPGFTFTISDCCGLGGVCATGGPVNGVTVAQCQAAVGAFNFDRPLFTPTILQGSADSSDQRAATDVNALGATSSECGGSRTYITKTTGKKK